MCMQYGTLRVHSLPPPAQWWQGNQTLLAFLPPEVLGLVFWCYRGVLSHMEATSQDCAEFHRTDGPLCCRFSLLWEHRPKSAFGWMVSQHAGETYSHMLHPRNIPCKVSQSLSICFSWHPQSYTLDENDSPCTVNLSEATGHSLGDVWLALLVMWFTITCLLTRSSTEASRVNYFVSGWF